MTGRVHGRDPSGAERDGRGLRAAPAGRAEDLPTRNAAARRSPRDGPPSPPDRSAGQSCRRARRRGSAGTWPGARGRRSAAGRRPRRGRPPRHARRGAAPRSAAVPAAWARATSFERRRSSSGSPRPRQRSWAPGGADHRRERRVEAPDLSRATVQMDEALPAGPQGSVGRAPERSTVSSPGTSPSTQRVSQRRCGESFSSRRASTASPSSFASTRSRKPPCSASGCPSTEPLALERAMKGFNAGPRRSCGRSARARDGRRGAGPHQGTRPPPRSWPRSARPRATIVLVVVVRVARRSGSRPARRRRTGSHRRRGAGGAGRGGFMTGLETREAARQGRRCESGARTSRPDLLGRTLASDRRPPVQRDRRTTRRRGGLLGAPPNALSSDP